MFFFLLFFFFKQKTAYEMRISDWSSDVCSSDLLLTYTLFTQLFHHSRGTGYPRLLRATQWAGLVLLAGALLLPYTLFKPLMWLICAFGILVMAFLLAKDRKSVV